MAPALYAETEFDKFASIAILVHKDADIPSLENLQGRRMCMPEFGGIASVEFMNTLKANNLITKEDCNLGKLMGEHFGDSCIPGSLDSLHDPQGTVSDKLCNLCRTTVGPAVVENADVLPEESPSGRVLEEGEVGVHQDEVSHETLAQHGSLTEEEIQRRYLPGSCSADVTNRYFGNRGALQCLSEIGEVAVLEVQYLNGKEDGQRLFDCKFVITISTSHRSCQGTGIEPKQLPYLVSQWNTG